VNNNESKEFRLKGGSIILNYIKSFSVTEKTVFVFLVIIATITSILMLINVSEHFMVLIPKSGGELREGIIGLPHMINPVLAITDVDRDITSLVYSGLMKYDGENLTTDLAESFKVSDDGLTYTFTLRPNIYFHDGSQLTTEDIYFTIQKVQDATLKSPRRPDWNNVSVNILSPREIQFTLKQPYSPFLTNTTLGILPKHIWNNIIDDQFVFSKYNIEPIGSGPYKLKSLTKDDAGIPQEYTLAASTNYYNSKAYLNYITFIFFPDTEKALSALEKGYIQSIASLSSKQAQTISKENYNIITTPLPRIFGAFFNQNNNPILADRTVRQALDLAIDRQAIINSALDGYGSPIYGPLPYGLSVSTSSKQTTNLELARSILEKTGWVKNPSTGIYEKKGPKNTIQILSFDLVTADTTDLKLTAQIIKDAWTNLGAKIEVKIFDTGELYQNIIRPRKYDILLFGQLIGKDRDLYAFWHSSQRSSPGLNVSMYTNSKADDILESIRTSGDKKTNQDKYNSLEQIIKNDIPAVFLYSPNFIYVLPKDIKNNLQGNMNITNPSDRWNSVTNWYINTEKVWPYFAR
jgi:peptide/nickel transport system substrate-binding protein